MTKKTIESLIYADCFSSFGLNKKTLIENLNVFDFNLMKEDIDKIRNLSNDDKKIGSNPDTADF